MRVEGILDQKEGAKESARVYTFVAAANPRCSPKALAEAAIRKMSAPDRPSYYIPVDMGEEMEGKESLSWEEDHPLETLSGLSALRQQR